MPAKPKSGPAAQVPALPDKNRTTFEQLVGLTDAFCDQHLDAEYKHLCRKMATILCEEEPGITRGKPAGWAAGIVSSIGYVNFLGDPSTKPYMRLEEVARGFGVSEATMHARSRVIRDGFDLMPFHQEWCVPSMLEHNPLVWMLQVNGLMVDVRSMPRDVQELAYARGLIPYIPEDRPPTNARPDELADGPHV